MPTKFEGLLVDPLHGSKSGSMESTPKIHLVEKTPTVLVQFTEDVQRWRIDRLTTNTEFELQLVRRSTLLVFYLLC